MSGEAAYAVEPSADRPVHGIRTALRRGAVAPGWLLILAMLPVGWWSGSLPEWLLYAPLLASFLFLGLPHGAVDHLVLLRQRKESLRARSLVRVVAEYLALAGVYLTWWLLDPASAFLFFIGLTWYHWGQGDVYALSVLLEARYLSDRFQRCLTLLVRGGLPMLVPLLAFPDVYAEVAALVIDRLQPLAAGRLAWVFSDGFRLGAGLGFGALMVTALARGLLLAGRSGRRAWWIDFSETVGLATFFATVHPVLAVGLYFCGWHAARHIARLMAGAPGPARALREGRPGRAWAWFVRQAWPATVGALVLLGALLAALPAVPSGPAELVGVYLVLIAVLTLPHVWVVCRMDRADALALIG